MKPAPFEYRLASSVDEAIAMLSQASGHAIPMAGGQTLGPLLNLRLVQPDRVVDISRIELLRQCREEGGEVVLGACVSHSMIEDVRIADPSNGLLPHVASAIAYRSVRNRGTVGGSLAYADPSAEWLTVMTALAARIDVCGPNGSRTVPLKSFVDGPMSTSLDRAELVLGVRIQKLAPNARWGFKKLCRRSGDFAQALAAVVIHERTRVVIGATQTGPLDMRETARLVDTLAGCDDVEESAVDDAFMADVADAGLTLDDYERQIHRHTLCCAIKDAVTP